MWLIDKTKIPNTDIFNKILSGRVIDREVNAGAAELKAGPQPTVFSIAGKSARIEVKGVLTEEPNFFMRYFGIANTSYSELHEAIDTVESDPDVKDVEFYFNSPGGQVSGLFQLMDKIKGMAKPRSAKVGQASLSASFGLSAVVGMITAEHYSSAFGSVGVVVDFSDDPGLVSITSDGAENKRPDHKTPEGMAEIKRDLNAHRDLFLRHIGESRGLSNEEVMENYGKGSVFLAEEAKKRGMIDKVSAKWVKKPGKSVKKTAQEQEKDLNLNGNSKKKVNVMTLDELKADHPDLVAQIEANAENSIKDRIKAHAVLGDASGNKELALEGALTFEEPTAEQKAKHETSKWANDTKETFENDGKETETSTHGAGGDGRPEKSEAEKAAATVFDKLSAKHGLKGIK